MNITVSPAGRGRFHARLGDRHLTTTKTPFFDAARILKDQGVPLDQPLTMTHEGSGTVALRSTVGAAAKLSVQDNDQGIRLRRYCPNPFVLTEA